MILKEGCVNMLFDLNEYKDKKVHFIGIGGVSMSGLAAILLNNEIKVTGSDFKDSHNVQRLRSQGAEIFFGHEETNITDQDVVVYTAAISDDNPELKKAKALNLETYDRAHFLGHIIKNFSNSIAVTGTHGKTSTTSMLTSIALAANTDPTILVGANLPLIGGNYRIGDGDLFITEACEYKGSFLHFPGQVAVLLNLEADHLDYYRDLDHIISTFKEYLTLIPKDGTVVVNMDDLSLREVMKEAKNKNIITFGLHSGDLYARTITYDAIGRASFSVYHAGEFLMTLKLKVPGEFNVYNALGAIGSSIASNLPLEDIKKGLEEYGGVDKRFQELYQKKGIKVIDDYAHHPREILNSIGTALKMHAKRIHVVFQPHTYTRTKLLFHDFTESFDGADSLIILPVFAARELDTGLVTSIELVDAINERKTVETLYFETFLGAAEHLKENIQDGDLVLTMGAGDAVNVAYELEQLL